MNWFFIDEWEGESGIIKIDNKIVWQQAYAWCESVLPWYCKKFGINSCGNEYPDKIGQFVQFSTKHDSDEVTLSFSSTLIKDACKSSWGIDDVTIYLI